MKHRLFLCLMLALAGAGCDQGVPDESEPRVIPFETIVGAEGFVLTLPGTQLFRDESAWTLLWESTWTITDGQGAKTPPPEIDFDQKMVIGIYWGSGNSGCSNAVEAIETIIQRDGELVVLVGPLPNLGPCDALVYPIQMVQVDRSDLPVVFEGEVPE